MKQFFIKQVQDEVEATKRQRVALDYRITQLEQQLVLLEGGKIREEELTEKVQQEKAGAKDEVKTEKKVTKAEQAKLDKAAKAAEVKAANAAKAAEDKAAKDVESKPGVSDLGAFADYLESEFTEGTFKLLPDNMAHLSGLALLEPGRVQPYLTGAVNIGAMLNELDADMAAKEGIKDLAVAIGLIRQRDEKPGKFSHPVSPAAKQKLEFWGNRVSPQLIKFMMTRKDKMKDIGEDIAAIYAASEGVA